LISDIHANLEALEACLKAAPPYDTVANLGDIVGYGASPNEVTEQSRKLGSLFVRGNHDKACTGVSGLEQFNPIAGLAALWTQETLTKENFEWLRDLPQGPVELAVGAANEQDGADGKSPQQAKDGLVGDPGKRPSVFCVHGSPLDEDEYIISLHDALEVLLSSSAHITFFGHTHVQGAFALDAEKGGQALRPSYATKDQSERVEMPLHETAKYLINPGSIGQPRDGDWRAAFCLYDSERKLVTYYRVPYDLKGAQKRIIAAKLPERLALRLADGR
jgi:predicted phosphodiesterase